MPKIATRKSWGARPPRNRSRHNRKSIRETFIHYPGVSGSLVARDADLKTDEYESDPCLFLPTTLVMRAGLINTVSEEREFMRQIQNFHMDTRGWSDFAYSGAVFQSGRIYRGRGVDFIPAGQAGHNTNTFALLCVVGTDQPPSRAMIASVKDMIKMLEKPNLTGNEQNVKPHSAAPGANTACPGNHLRARMREFDRV